MSNGFVEEIRRQLNNNSMQDKEAIGFIVQLQLEIFDQLKDLKIGQKSQDDEIAVVKEDVKEIKEYQERYPSLIWLVYNRPWIFLLIMAVFVFVISIVVDPMNVVEFGNYIRGALWG